MQRIPVKNLRRGHETENYRVITNAERTESDGVSMRVAYHDGGEGVQTWDHPDIEIEVRNG